MIVFDNNELRRRIDEVLYYVWDPIGVAHEPYARGEYKGYVQKVLELVEQNDDIEPISLHLANIVKNRMGLSPDKKQCDYTAGLLLNHKQAIKEGYA
jgi:hypothetical protein